MTADSLCGGPTPLGGLHRPCTRPAGHPGECQVTAVEQLTGEPGPGGFLAYLDDDNVLQKWPSPAAPKYTRRFQLLPCIAVCDAARHAPPGQLACLWSFEGEDHGQVESKAHGHIDDTGHHVRMVSPSMVILGPPPPAPAAPPAEPVDVDAGQPA